MSTDTTKHTPGPWSYENTHDTIWIWGDNNEKIVMHVSNELELKDAVREENEANAALIAAAPDMYEALKKVKEFLHGEGHRGDNSGLYYDICVVLGKAMTI